MIASELVEVLRAHHVAPNRPAGGIFATEIASPTGSRRADAVWLPTTIAAGHELVGYEVKVSRADVRSELADPTKSEEWSRHCDRWWLVVSDPSIVDLDEVPAAWGVLSPPSGRNRRTMNTLRPAPLLRPVDRDEGVRRVAAWLFVRTEARELERVHATRRLEDDLASARRNVELADARLAAVGSSRYDHDAATLAALHARVLALRAERGVYGAFDVEATARAVVDLAEVSAAVGRVRNDARGRLRDLERATSDPSRSLEDVRRLLADASGEAGG